MNWKLIHVVLLIAAVTAITGLAQPVGHFGSLAEFQKRAAKFNSIISLPQFETGTKEVVASVQKTITNGNAALDRIGGLNPKKVTFQNTIKALDDVGYQI